MNLHTPPVPDWPGADPDAAALAELTAALAEADGPVDESGAWSDLLWAALARAGATRWGLPRAFGGDGLDHATLTRRYARIAEGSLTAAFVLSQHDAAVRRLAAGSARGRAGEWLHAIANGLAFATVGISQLTTSRRHGSQALVATEVADGYRLDGVMPWVTAAHRANVIVTGAVMPDGRQLLIALPTDRPGIDVRPPFPLAALQASSTCEVGCDRVPTSSEDILAGPVPDVMSTPGAASTGGLESSALALGQARAALVALSAERARRDDLDEPIEALTDSWLQAATDLLAAAEGRVGAPTPARIRSQANALALRSTQAYLTARKGTGFLRTEPAQRWARQALFFLVWSCPTPVAQAALRDFAGLCTA